MQRVAMEWNERDEEFFLSFFEVLGEGSARHRVRWQCRGNRGGERERLTSQIVDRALWSPTRSPVGGCTLGGRVLTRRRLRMMDDDGGGGGAWMRIPRRSAARRSRTRCSL